MGILPLLRMPPFFKAIKIWDLLPKSLPYILIFFLLISNSLPISQIVNGTDSTKFFLEFLPIRSKFLVSVPIGEIFPEFLENFLQTSHTSRLYVRIHMIIVFNIYSLFLLEILAFRILISNFHSAIRESSLLSYLPCLGQVF